MSSAIQNNYIRALLRVKYYFGDKNQLKGRRAGFIRAGFIKGVVPHTVLY